ncbi:Dual-specificity kinase, spindle pole body (SPB) duplication and spindle checkpoint function, partial [Pseudocyphellaria aurata]|nr:Dual-specificity kinase, spindle pole body (SPB) duplication and spindle checkpoint function [Pseudocyphellaria aurata]
PSNMATASPTPFANHNLYPRRPLSRNNVRSQPLRPHLKRGSPLSVLPTVNVEPPSSWKLSIGDSSDDEVPVPPMKLSAEAKAILGDDASVIEGSPTSQQNAGGSDLPHETYKPWARRSPTALRPELKDRVVSPAVKRTGSPRIVRLSPAYNGLSTIRRSASVLNGKGIPKTHASEDLITPAPRLRNMQKNESADGSKVVSSGSYEPSTIIAPSSSISQPAAPGTVAGEGKEDVHDAVAQMGGLSISRSKIEDGGVQGSVRIKRAGKVTGRFLSGPARRGMKRRPSEEESPLQGDLLSSGEALASVSKNEKDLVGIKIEPISPKPTPPKVDVDQAGGNGYRHRFRPSSSLITGSPGNIDEKKAKIAALEVVQPKPRPSAASGLTGSSGQRLQPTFKVPPLPLLPSRFDQENEPPPTFKRNKPNGLALSERAPDEKMLIRTPATSPPRQALAPRNQNTPHRPAPPPPRMTVLETATATAGAASASQSRKKRNYISVNGKVFTRMDCIGRGGSSKVYRVMAENYKVFALKRVALEDQDENAIRGFKGEIDLLRKLENVDRVVRLFDCEINEEKHTLSVLMEMGESDLSRVLTLRLNAEDAMFDITFTRYFWKEMLECVRAVHAHDIVHSDLKPANFLLAQGRLKLIDFGISNTIQDHTVNVHRDQHVGTPNYMSPEALIDSNPSAGLAAADPAPKLMKLGKPSDVWSLGCILYQMVYGKPPFAHIANINHRIMAIPNPRHPIAFPAVGIGAAPLPSGLLATIRRCLNRDPTLRPTVAQLLAPADLFLDPDAKLEGTVPVGVEWIATVQDCILKHVREKGMPTEAELEVWPRRIWGGIRAAVDEGRGPW